MRVTKIKASGNPQCRHRKQLKSDMPIGNIEWECQVALITKPIASGEYFLTGGGPHPSSIGSICSFPTWPLQGTLIHIFPTEQSKTYQTMGPLGGNSFVFLDTLSSFSSPCLVIISHIKL